MHSVAKLHMVGLFTAVGEQVSRHFHGVINKAGSVERETFQRKTKLKKSLATYFLPTLSFNSFYVKIFLPIYVIFC